MRIIYLSCPFVRLEKISVELLNHEQIFIASVINVVLYLHNKYYWNILKIFKSI